MREFAFAMLISAMLILAGCAQQPSPQPSPPAAPPVITGTEEPPAAEPQTNGTGGNETNQTQPEEPPAMAQPDSCEIQFQKTESGIYYVMVSSDSEKAVSVSCPNGKAASEVGELYFCEQLDIDAPVVAYLSGEECDSVNFAKAAYENIPQGAMKCTIFVQNKRITVGKSTLVNIQTSTGGKQVELTYNCGSETKTFKRSGLETDGTLCQYDTPGTVVVDAKIDGVTCDTEVVEVFAESKDCSVYGSAVRMEEGKFVHTAKVAARGYSGNDRLSYLCFGDYREIRVDNIPNSADFVTEIECKGSQKMAEPIIVKMSGNVCGDWQPPES